MFLFHIQHTLEGETKVSNHKAVQAADCVSHRERMLLHSSLRLMEKVSSAQTDAGLLSFNILNLVDKSTAIKSNLDQLKQQMVSFKGQGAAQS